MPASMMRKGVVAGLLLALLVLSPAADASFGKKKKTKKKSSQQVSRHCDGNACGVLLEFYPPSDQEGSFDCFWNRVEVDLPKYSTWTMDKDSVQIYAPGNSSCSVNDIYLSSSNILDLEAPTLDCYRSVGCLCNSITPKANKAIGWAPATQLLKHNYTRTVCREARTFLYIRLNCTLTTNDLTPEEKLDNGYDYNPYYEDQLVAPATVFVMWNRTYDYNARDYNLTTNTTGNSTRRWCKYTANTGLSGTNRWFLTFMLLAAVVVLALLVTYIAIRAIWGVISRKSVGVEGRGVQSQQLQLQRLQRPTSFIGEVLTVDLYNGRDRWLTALLVAGVGLYIAGTIFEPSIRAQNAYERAISPSLTAATVSLTNVIDAGSFTSFLQRVVRLALTIALCSAWGAILFLALLYNLSSPPAPAPSPVPSSARRTKLVHATKLVLSVLALLLLDVGFVIYFWSSFENRGRWRTPGAYWFLLHATSVFYAVPHVKMLLLVFRHQPVCQDSPRLGDAASHKVNLDDFLPAEKRQAYPNGGSDLQGRATAKSRDTRQSPFTEMKIRAEAEKIAVAERVRRVLAWLKGRLAEEEQKFRYSPWFVAPMIIALVLLLFFFIKELYIINSVHQCLGLKPCFEWSGFNSAVIPVLTSFYHAILTARPPAEFLKLLTKSLIESPARDILSSLQNDFSATAIENRVVQDNLASFNFPTAVLMNNSDLVTYQNLTKPYTVTVWENATSTASSVNLTSKPQRVAGYSAALVNREVYVNNLTWIGFYLTSATFLEDYSRIYYTCNFTTINSYISETADKAYDMSLNQKKVDSTADLLGMTGVDFVQQILTTVTAPLVQELCGKQADDFVKSRSVNNVLAEIMQSVVNATDQANNRINATVSRAEKLYQEQQQRLMKQVKRAKTFYSQLKQAFALGGYIGAGMALGVALMSLVVIASVYKQAVLRMQKQVAVMQVLKHHPDGQLLQETLLGQREKLDELLGDNSSSGPGSQPHLFAALDLMKESKLPLSIFFYGIVFSTVLLQLVVCSVLFILGLTAVLHPMFWSHAFPILVSFIATLAFSQLVVLVIISGAVGSKIAPNDKIVNLSSWIAYFVIFSFAYIILGVLLAVVRLVFIFLSAIVMSCRIDMCLNLLHRILDPAYNGFLCMMKMQVEMKSFAEGDSGDLWDAQADRQAPTRKDDDLAAVTVDNLDSGSQNEGQRWN